ncbi:hypothetical protein KAT24_00330 [Candidatus Pacearchaeota archaeon]|nr:hypothetical protein [Candidatus Pacearchaeota archaeon]
MKSLSDFVKEFRTQLWSHRKYVRAKKVVEKFDNFKSPYERSPHSYLGCFRKEPSEVSSARIQKVLYRLQKGI